MNRTPNSLSAAPPGPASGSARASTLTGLVTIVMTLLGWSAVPLFITHFSTTLDAWTSNGWRYGFSALLWAPVLVWGWKRASLPEGLWRAAAWPAVFNTLGQVAFTWSFYRTDPTTATFGLRMQIVFVAIGAYLLFPQERALLRRPATWLSIVLVLGGVTGTILLSPGAQSPEQIAANTTGVLLAVLSGLLFAGYALSVRRCMRGFHPVTAFAAISQYTALGIVSLMLIAARDQRSGAWDGGLSAWAMPDGQFALLLLSAIIGIALGHVFYYIAIARLGVAVSSGVVQLQPFLVAVGSYLVLSKPVTAGQMAAGMVAVCGAVLLLWVQWRLSHGAAAAAAAEMPLDFATTPEPTQAVESR